MKLNLKDLEKYLLPLKRVFSKYRQIKNTDQVKKFIQEQSSLVSQLTLYGYLKTRMGAKHVLMFEDKDFLKSINIAKWHVYTSSLIDCTFFCFSYLYKERGFFKKEEANKIFMEIINNEKINGMNIEAYENAKKEFNSRYETIDWNEHYKFKPFEHSCNELYRWSPIADELKKLDKKIVINSMFLKWNNVQIEFKRLTNKFNTG